MQQLISTGTVKRGTLGIETQDLTPEIAQLLETPPGKGAVVTRVQANSPAGAAGLKPGDVVLEVNGKPVQNEQDLRNSEGLLPIGAAVELQSATRRQATDAQHAFGGGAIGNDQRRQARPRVWRC